MPKRTPFLVAADTAHAHLLRGFDKAWTNAGKVPIGHHIIDPRTLESRQMTNLALTNNPQGMTSGLPEAARKLYQTDKHIQDIKGQGQTEKNKAAGVVVDPTAHETFTGADPIAVDTTGGYGLTPGPFPNN